MAQARQEDLRGEASFRRPFVFFIGDANVEIGILLKATGDKYKSRSSNGARNGCSGC
jgi:hypothetical protein